MRNKIRFLMGVLFLFFCREVTYCELLGAKGFDNHRILLSKNSGTNYPILTSPNGGEIWAAGSSHCVTWTTVGTGHKSFRLLFGNWNNVPYAFSSQHPYSANFDSTWEISQPGTPKIKVHFDTINTESGCDYIYVYDKNNNPITQYTGAHGNIWTPEIPGDRAKIRLKTDGTVQKYGFYIDSISCILADIDTIDNNIPGTSVSCDWKVPPINSPVNWLRLEMLDSLDSVIDWDMNDSSFAIMLSAKLVYPNGGESWVGNTVYTIKWRMVGGEAVSTYKLIYSTDGGATYPYLIAENIAATDSTYDLTTPNIASDSLRVKVIAYTSVDSVWDTSDNNFYIAVGAEEKITIPTIFFAQNYPNPFKLSTDIKYGLPGDANVDISIYNLSGQKVINLENGFIKAGCYVKKWDGKDQSGKYLASGIYFCKFDTPYYKKINKIYLIR
ncbi:MAG: T9SS type A sorting domain-containing protein [bacterium]|nr:T9SS type A sorting domain-containing protein [bacterium]